MERSGTVPVAEPKGPHGHPRSLGHGAGAAVSVGAVRPDGYVYKRAPMLVYWETTLACGLACSHCRATAMPHPAPDQLTTEEGIAFLNQITGFGRPYPHVVFTGGDPLRRDDLETLVEAASARGIGSSLAPAATESLTRERLSGLQAAGIQTIALSLDGSDAERHDGFRGVPGTFECTLRSAGLARDLGLPLQVNTLVTDKTLPDLPAIFELMHDLRVMRWSLFFLISIGRGTGLQEIGAGDAERLHQWLYEVGKTAPFAIKTTEATHFRRVAIKHMVAEGMSDEAIAATPVGRGFGIRDGNGIVFVSHRGDVCPSGFLPLSTGNVRQDDIVELYREHPIFVSLRDVSTFKGRCGRCEYVDVCGGSRARAYAHTGDVLESDPLCPYVPRAA